MIAHWLVVALMIAVASQQSGSLSDTVLYGDVKAVQALIANGANVNEVDPSGMTPLMVAASEGKAAIAQLLIDAGADVKQTGDDGSTALMRAASANRVDVMGVLMAKGAEVNAKNRGGMTALMVAAYGGYAGAVRALLTRKADPNVKDNQGRSALMAAATSGDLATLETLLDAGADPTVADVGHGTPMTYAAAEGRADVMAALQKRGLKPNAGDLALAAGGCHTLAVRLALAAGVAPDAADAAEAPLPPAAAGNCLEVVQLLLDRRANVNAKDRDGWTALMKAAEAGHADLVRLLMDRGADMNVADANGRTAWMLAAMGGHTEIATIFKQARAAQGPSHRLTVTSAALTNDQPMPRQYTADGRNESPPLAWSNVPEGVKSFAVMCEDPDGGNPPPFVHWVIYNIPGEAAALPAALPFEPDQPMPKELAGAVQGLSGFRRPFYRGPAPPPGKPHHYHFIVYALDLLPDMKPALTRADLLAAITGHILGQGEIVATYERK